VIYELPDQTADIRQGDIFVDLPRLEISLDSVMLVGPEAPQPPTLWETVHTAAAGGPVVLAVAARPVAAIVITQDCDLMRAEQITLCEIRPLDEVIKENLGTKDWAKNLLKQMQRNLKWFYLPVDTSVGFQKRMAVDFQVTLSVPREDLLNRRALRRGRLNREAYQHFRERLAQFFRRYPVDEWYPLTREEFEAYRKGDSSIKPRPWQTP
jgi:hypothetical protein